MASGYRLVLRDIGPGLWRGVREVVDYTGFAVDDEVVTAPGTSVSAPGGIVVSKNLHRLAVISAFHPFDDATDTPKVSIVAVTWDEGDVLETIETGSAVIGGPYEIVDPGPPKVFAGVPDPPVPFVLYTVTAVDVGAELSLEDINDAALDISLQEA
jgi:hypothetical protein